MMDKNTKIFLGVLAFLLACGLVVGAVLLVSSGLYLTTSSGSATLHYFTTIDELLNSKESSINKPIRISGAVLGDSIQYDDVSKSLSFVIVNVPATYQEIEQQGGLAVVLQTAVNDTARGRLTIVYFGQKPELLGHLAQAIVIGQLHSDGVFYAEEILLKCPSRYEESIPDQAIP